jgi:ribosome-associated protein
MRKLTDRLRVQAQAEADDRDLTSRSDLRREEQAKETLLRRLAQDLVGLNPRQLERLALDGELLEAVQHAQALGDSRARARQVGVVRQQLRDLPENARDLSERVAALKEGSLPPAPRERPAPNEAVEGWVERFIAEGDTALEEFFALHPEADRQSLRQGARAASKARETGDASSATIRATQRLRSELGRWL